MSCGHFDLKSDQKSSRPKTNLKSSVFYEMSITEFLLFYTVKKL
jgi:hypothetical protein